MALAKHLVHPCNKIVFYFKRVTLPQYGHFDGLVTGINFLPQLQI
jgi:hypothetical protein